MSEDDMNGQSNVHHINREDGLGNITDDEFKELFTSLDEIAEQREALGLTARR